MNITIGTAAKITFVMVDSSTTEVAGLGDGFTLTISKNGGAFGASAGAKAEIGNGWYSYTFTTTETNTLGPLAVKVTGAGAVQQNLLYQIDSGASDPLLSAVPGTYTAGTAGWALGRIGSGRIHTTSIISQSGLVQTVRGDSYYSAEGRRIEWTDDDAGWPDISGSSIAVNVGGEATFVGAVITPSGANKKVGVELSEAQTLLISANTNPGHDYSVIATLPNGHKVTLVATNQPDNADEDTHAKWVSVDRITT